MKSAAVVLAAGNSTRMGQQKLLLPFNGVTVIEHIIQTLKKSDVTDIIVVVGRDAELIRGALEGCAVTIVDNPDYEEGMLTSVRAGIGALDENIQGCLVCLGDQPALQDSVIEHVLTAGKQNETTIIVPEYKGKRGHPLFIPRDYWQHVLTSYDDVGLRGLLHEFNDDVHGLRVEESWILDDMDYPEDYQRELNRLAGDN